ncbi:TPA: transposase, partial [Streptococcus pneumoniae]|nr:transposase [Streptococcus pneumoniae]
ARQLFPCAKIVLDRFHIVQHLSRAMSRVRVQIMNQFHRKSHEYKAIKRNAFGFRNFENFKKRIFIALNIKKERTKFVLSRA